MSVSDLARSTAWYCQLLDLSRFRELPDPQGRWERVILRHPGGLLIGLTAHQNNPREPASESRSGVDHIAFRVPGVGSLHAWLRRLDELGVEHSEIKSSPLGHLIAFRDPDHIQLEFYAPLEY